MASTAQAQTQAATERAFNISAQPLADALVAFAAQSGYDVTTNGATLRGVQSAGVQGRFTPPQALSQLLGGTGFTFRITGNVVTIEAAPQAGKAIQLGPVRVEGSVREGDSGYTSDRSATEFTRSYAPSGPVTTATPLNLTVRETPQSVSVITTQRMEDQHLSSVRQTLENAPGITLVQSGTERFQATSRGYQITNYQLDGINSHSDYGGAAGPASQSLADMAMFDRIEILRGASGLMTGAGDPSGAINMVRKKPTKTPYKGFELSVGSWEHKRGVVDVSGPLAGSDAVRGRLVAAYQDADGFTDYYSRRETLVYGVLEADLSERTRLTFGGDHKETESKGASTYVGFPLWFDNGERTDFPVSISLASRDNRFNTNSDTVFATLEHRLGEQWQFKASGVYGKSSQTEDTVYLEANGRFANAVTGDGLLLDAAGREYEAQFVTFEANLNGTVNLFGRSHELVFGLAYEDFEKLADGYFDSSGLDAQPANIYDWDRRGKAVLDLKAIDWDYYREQYSFYAAGRFALSDRVKLIAGTRLINYTDSLHTANIYGFLYEPKSSEKGVLTPYGGLIYDVSESHTLYASYTTIYQPQYYRDSNGDLIPPREGANYEAGLKSEWFGGMFTTSASVFTIRQDNLTETDPAYILIPGTTAEYASRVIEGAQTSGFDLEANGEITPNWSVSASYTYSKTEDGTGKAVRTTFPREIAKLWTTWRLPGELSRLTIGGGVNWQSKVYSTIYAWRIDKDLYWEQKPYALFSLMGRYDLTDTVTATLNVSNVFDTKYISAANDFWYSGNYGAPRRITLTLRGKF